MICCCSVHSRNAAAVLGTLYVLRVMLGFLWGLGGGLCAYVLAPLGISRINLRKYGPWAGMPVVSRPDFSRLRRVWETAIYKFVAQECVTCITAIWFHNVM